jgi:hypothetical protein
MKLLRSADPGREKPALLASGGSIRDLSGLVGERRQTGTTRKIIFPIADLVSCITQFMKLMPGDVVTTGTPPGVGLGMKPPQFLKPGDMVTLGVARLGTQRQTIVGPDSGGQNLHSGSEQ